MSRQQCMHRHCSYIPASAVGSKLSGLLYHLSIVKDVHFYVSDCCRAIRRKTHSLLVKVC